MYDGGNLSIVQLEHDAIVNSAYPTLPFRRLIPPMAISFQINVLNGEMVQHAVMSALQAIATTAPGIYAVSIPHKFQITVKQIDNNLKASHLPIVML